MIPGVNPKQMKKMMKQLGMKMDTIEDVERVVIYTKNGNYVCESAEVVSTTMQGSTSYQITGDMTFEEAAAVIPDEDVELVAMQAEVSAEEAKKALEAANGDIAAAILTLAEDKE